MVAGGVALAVVAARSPTCPGLAAGAAAAIAVMAMANAAAAALKGPIRWLGGRPLVLGGWGLQLPGIETRE